MKLFTIILCLVALTAIGQTAYVIPKPPGVNNNNFVTGDNYLTFYYIDWQTSWKYENGVWQIDSLLTDNFARKIEFDSDNTGWFIGLGDDEVFKYENYSVIQVSDFTTLFGSSRLMDIYIDGNDNVWVCG